MELGSCFPMEHSRISRCSSRSSAESSSGEGLTFSGTNNRPLPWNTGE